MTSIITIHKIFDELTSRYNQISTSTIKSILDGRTKSQKTTSRFRKSKNDSPRLNEAEDAFKRFNCVIFTAFRGGYSLDENLERNQKLKSDMDKDGLKYRPVTGCYREADWEYANIEYCYFVYNDDLGNDLDFFTKAYRLSEKYDQDSFLYKRAGINRSAFLVASTDAGRTDLKGDIRYAGQLFLHVPDVEAWTDCSDGRFAFQLKGMVLISTGIKQIKIGEGNLFDTSEYGANGLVVIRRTKQNDIKAQCKDYKEKVPLVQHVFKKDNPSEEYIHDVVFSCLKKMRDKKCRRIGFHCSVMIDGSTEKGAAFVFETIKNWVERYNKNIQWIVVVDIYGDYRRALDMMKDKNSN